MDISEITESLLCQELMTELKICKNNGLFLALYQDKNVIKAIINHLKKNLPGTFAFTFPLGPGPDFAAFFKQLSARTGKTGSIIHIAGIEMLAEYLRPNLMDYFQHSKSNPCSLVFWIMPQFEKQLFLSAPDFCHRVSGTYDFTDFTDSARIKTEKGQIKKAPGSKKQSLLHKTMADYLNKILWQYEHWQDVKDKNEPFLIKPMERSDLNDFYVPSYCTENDDRKLLIDNTVDEFLADESGNFLMLLGDYGTGKTCFSIYKFVCLAKQYLQNKNEQRIPIFISLEDYQGKITVEDFIVKEFSEKYNLKITFSTFQKLASKGKFVFIVDGFDEMASSDKEITRENLRELAKLGDEKASKVFFTCVTHYLLSPGSGSDPVHTELYSDYAQKISYRIVSISPKQLDDKQLEEYVSKKADNERRAENFLEIIKNPYNLEKLSGPDLLPDMAVNTLPILGNKKEINISSLYKTYTGTWICRNDWTTELSPEEKKNFLWQLALKTFKKSDNFSLSLSEPGPSFLKTDAQGNYQFVHKSFMEYFLAEYYFDLIISKKERIVSYNDFNEETKYFLKLIISSEKHSLQNMNLSNLSLEKINLSQADFTGSDLQRTNLSEADITGADLSRTDLTRANLSRSVLNKTVLTQARLILTDITGADLREADMTDANLQRADLAGADITGATLRKASINDADFTDANLRKTNLNETDFRWANLQRANLSSADMTEINLLKANLGEADMTDANLLRANLSDADLTGANLIRTDLRWANINKTNLSGANLSEANLSEANLWKANLQKADLAGANLQKSSLVKADLRWANLSKADLTGADLWQANLNEADLTGAIYKTDELQKAYLEGAKI